MKKQMLVITGIILVLVVAGILYWWFGMTKPTTGEIENATKNIKQVDANILNSKTAKEIENRKIMGNIPVEVSDDYSHTNLFE